MLDMKIRKGYKYRLKPTSDQRQKFAQFAGACRFVYNKALGINNDRYLARTPRINYHDQARLLALWKRSEEWGWLKDIDSQVLQQTLKNLDRGYTNLFNGIANPPTFRRKFQKDSFRYPQRFKVDRNLVYLPKIGWVTYVKHREWEGDIKSVTVSRQGSHWHVGFQVEVEIDTPVHPSDTSVGVDLDITVFAALSTGELIPPLNSFRRHEDRLARAQQDLSMMVKGSNRYQRQKGRIAQLHAAIADCRHDFTHKLSARLTDEHCLIVFEDLKIKNMSASASGTLEEPGHMVAQKSGLNKSILDQGWGMFKTQCDYKARWKGGVTRRVPAHYSSQECSVCGHTDPRNRPTQAMFHCMRCEHTENADTNASKVVVARGARETQNGRLGVKTSSEAQVL